MKGTKVLINGALGSLIPMVKNVSYIHMYSYAWISILLGWAFQPSCASYLQKWDRL